VGQPALPSLLPRYRRLLDVGGVLDETFRIFRRGWLPMLLAMAISAVPNAVLGLALTRLQAGSLLTIQPGQTGGAPEPSQVVSAMGSLYVGLVAGALLNALLVLPAGAAVTLMADGMMRGRRLPVWRSFVYGLRRTPALVLTGLATMIGEMLLVVPALLLLALGLFGTLGSLVALIGLILWLATPGARRPWLKWLIVLAAPFGLPVYYGVRWSLAYAAAVLERRSALASLRRSASLVEGHWFAVAATALVVSIAYGVLQTIPAWVATLGLGAIGVAVAPSAGAWWAAVQSIGTVAAGSLGWAAFGALPFIAFTLLFEDLRNRREGADLVERLDAIEATAGGAQPSDPAVVSA
jgi:hypothetical protein